MPFKNNGGVVNLKSMNTRQVVGKLPVPTFIPTSTKEFENVAKASKTPKGLPESIVTTQSKKPLDMPSGPMLDRGTGLPSTNPEWWKPRPDGISLRNKKG
jgi:hypothetical protein